jgi:hypothetical protein
MMTFRSETHQFAFRFWLWRNALLFEMRLAVWRARRSIRQTLWRAAWTLRLWQLIAGIEAGLLLGTLLGGVVG